MSNVVTVYLFKNTMKTENDNRLHLHDSPCPRLVQTLYGSITG